MGSEPAAHRRRTAFAAILIASALTSCASLRAASDPLCGQIARFANATEREGTHEVVLTTHWGPVSEQPNSLFQKECVHGGYAAGAPLCVYLVEETSTEFPSANFDRVAQCIGVAKPGKKFPHSSYERLSALVWGYDVPGVRAEVTVGVDISAGERETSTLKIIARWEGL